MERKVRQLHEIGTHQPDAPGLDHLPVFQVADAGNLGQVLVAVVPAPFQQDIAQLPDDVLALALDDDIKAPVVEGFLGQRAHLRAAADGDEVGMEFLGLARHLVGPGRFVYQRGQHQDVHAFQVPFRVNEAGAVFKPYFPLVYEGAFPLSEGCGQVEHTLPGNRHVLKVAAGGGRLEQHHPFDSRHFASLCRSVPACIGGLELSASNL